MIGKHNIITKKMIYTFLDLFSGLPHIYGTADRDYRNARVVKSRVSNRVIWSHISGKQPYGVFLLNKDRVRAIAVDFDTNDHIPPRDFVYRAKHYGLFSYIERSKSKGHHCWIFFDEQGALASKARLVVNQVLEDIEKPDTEVFPKQDALNDNVRFGNFINAPLFGGLVAKGRTVFIDPGTFNAYHDQWAFLELVNKVSESTLDDIIELNDLSIQQYCQPVNNDSERSEKDGFGLPPCARKMLDEGVSQYQRISCFRLAVHFKRLGLPFDVAVAALKIWALKNHPKDGKWVIRESEILSQTSSAYSNSYTGYGCKSEAIRPFCDHSCPVMKWLNNNKKAIHDNNETVHEIMQ